MRFMTMIRALPPRPFLDPRDEADDAPDLPTPGRLTWEIFVVALSAAAGFALALVVADPDGRATFSPPDHMEDRVFRRDTRCLFPGPIEEEEKQPAAVSTDPAALVVPELPAADRQGVVLVRLGGVADLPTREANRLTVRALGAIDPAVEVRSAVLTLIPGTPDAWLALTWSRTPLPLGSPAVGFSEVLPDTIVPPPCSPSLAPTVEEVPAARRRPDGSLPADRVARPELPEPSLLPHPDSVDPGPPPREADRRGEGGKP